MTDPLATDGRRLVGYVVVLVLLVAVLLVLAAHLANASEAPGCGQQHYRPRLAACCPTYQYAVARGDNPLLALPPKCTHAYEDGFLAECCGGPVPTPTATIPCDAMPEGCGPKPSPSPDDCFTCDLFGCWPAPCASPSCAVPTPQPTPEDHAKGACCAEARAIYKAAFFALTDRYRVEKRTLQRIKREQMTACKAGY